MAQSSFPYFSYPFSVHANGMGQLGVSFTTPNNYYFNPANLGLLAFENKYYLSGYLKETDRVDILLREYHLSVPYKLNDQIKFGMAFSYAETETSQYMSYAPVPQYNNQITNNFFRVTASVGYHNHYYLAAGINFTVLQESIYGHDDNAFNFDLGLRGGYPHSFILNENYSVELFPSIGMAVSKIGTELEFKANADVFDDQTYKVTIPQEMRIGISNRLTLRNNSLAGGFDLFSLLTAYELEDLSNHSTTKAKYGVEGTLFETVSARTGKNRNYEYDEWGLSAHLSGLKKLLFGRLLSDDSILGRVDATFNYAKQTVSVQHIKTEGTDYIVTDGPYYYTYEDVDYFELIISISL